jgi:hypothetical protein
MRCYVNVATLGCLQLAGVMHGMPCYAASDAPQAAWRIFFLSIFCMHAELQNSGNPRFSCLDLHRRPEYVDAQGFEALGMGGSALAAMHRKGGISLSQQLMAHSFPCQVLQSCLEHCAAQQTCVCMFDMLLRRPEYVDAQGFEALGMGGSVLAAMHKQQRHLSFHPS